MAKKDAKAATAEKKVPKKKPTGFKPVQFKDHTISQKRTGRFQVVNAKGKNVNGAEKVKLLLESKLMKGSFKKAGKEESTAT